MLTSITSTDSEFFSLKNVLLSKMYKKDSYLSLGAFSFTAFHLFGHKYLSLSASSGFFAVTNRFLIYDATLGECSM